MKIYNGIHEWKKTKKPIVMPIGVFDGAHIGHQSIINKSGRLAKKLNAKNIVLTFDLHPRSLLYPEQKVAMLTTNEEKTELLKTMEIDGIIFLYFGHAIAEMTPEDFFKKVLVQGLGVKGIVVGSNFCFGNNRSGNIDLLKKMGKEHDVIVEIARDIKLGGKIVSSTLIRKCMERGDVATAAKYLGRLYSVDGLVVHGKAIGSKYNVPTVNLHIPYGKLIPRGVYGGYAEVLGKKRKAVINCGNRPTLIHDPHRFTVEAHILEFSSDLYNKNVKIYFKEKIRDEKKYKNMEELFNQVNRDIEYVRKRVSV
ncbi:MAG: bifunctional riboflavin kinase/FAD synthetase [Elusimicrobiota bacterium]